MGEHDEREGKRIYSEGVVDVRTFPKDPEAHVVYIRERGFLFQHDVLKEVVERSGGRNLANFFDNYNPGIICTLKENNMSPVELTLVLARARVKELEQERDYFIDEARKAKESSFEEELTEAEKNLMRF